MPPETPDPDRAHLAEALRTRAAEAETVLARTDHAHAVLAALSTALVVAAAAGVGVTGQDAALSGPAQTLMGAALAVVAVALLVLLTAIRPRRGVAGHALSGVPAYAALTPSQLRARADAEPEPDYLAERVVTVSRIATAKHARQRLAIVLMMVAVVLMVAGVGAVLL